MDPKKLLQQVRSSVDKLNGAIINGTAEEQATAHRKRTVKVDRAKFSEAMAHLNGLATALEVLSGD